MKIIVEGRWNAAFSFNRKGRYPMNFFEKELRNLFGSSPMLRDAHYCGRTCLAKLDEELRVKLQFTTTGYADHYDAIKLAVINRTDGVVDQQLFRFSDIIGQQAVRAGTLSIPTFGTITAGWNGTAPSRRSSALKSPTLSWITWECTKRKPKKTTLL